MNKKKVQAKNKKIGKPIFDASSRDYLMRNNRCSVGFNMPKALKGEVAHGLPPYQKRMPYLVDEYEGCPSDWMRSEGKLKSYFVPVKENKGMWLDFNNNDNHTHHVAVVVSIQGINPITGLPCKNAHLEQYIEECPKHKIKFGPDRFCKKCDFKWPKQNYICSTATPTGQFWLDGFRSADGVVRQYILTAEKMRGVASNIIGKDRVYAIGLSFFLSKEKKPAQQSNGLLRGFHTAPQATAYPNFTYLDNTIDYNVGGTSAGSPPDVYGSPTASCGAQLDNMVYLSSCSASNSSAFNSPNRRRRVSSDIKVKKLEIGAGAKINQLVYDDPEKLDYWHDDPESIICINYCSEVEARKIIEEGEIDIEGSKEGFLKDIPVGN